MKNINILFHIFIYVILFNSCTKDPAKYVDARILERKTMPVPTKLEGVIVEFDEEIMKPMQITLIDSVLILTNINTENFLYKYNLNNRKKINEALSHGSGPNEALSVYKSQIIDSTIWFMDQGRQRILQYGLYDICFSDVLIPLQAIQLKDLPNNLLVLSDNKLVTTNLLDSEKRFSFYDMEGQYLNAEGKYPNYGVELGAYEKVESFICNICLNSSRNKIFASYMRTDLIEVYDTNGNLLKQIHGPDLFFPQLVQKDANDGSVRVMSLEGETRHAYFSPMTVGEEVWVLYSGKILDFEDPANFSTNTIFAFNWEGELKKILELDTPIFAFTVDTTSSVIYGISDNPEYHILSFKY